MSVRLKAVADLVTECASDGVRPFVSLEHIEAATGQLTAPEALLDVEAPHSGAARAEAGDVLFGKLRPYLAKTWLVDRPVYASTELMCLRPRPLVEPRWLAYLVASTPVIQWSVATSAGTKMPRTSWEKLAAFRVQAVPSISAQRVVANHLDREVVRINALIAAKRRMGELVSNQFAAQRDIALLEAPGMTWIPLQYLTDPYRPIVYGIVQAGDEVPDGVPYIKTGDLANFRPQLLSRTSKEIDRAYSRARVFPGDIVIAMRASIGLPVVVPPELPIANLTQGTARVAARKNVSGRWLFHALRSRAVQEQCDIRAVGTTFRTLNIWDLRRIKVPTPPSFAEQERLADVLHAGEKRLDELTAALHTQIVLLQERRQALISTAVTGGLDIPEAA